MSRLPTCYSPPLGHSPYLPFFGFLHLTGIQVTVQQLVMEALGRRREASNGSSCSCRVDPS